MTLQISYNFLVFFKYKHYPMVIGFSGDYGELTPALWDKNKVNL